MIENRQPLDYDAQMKGSGILIWHIDDRQDLQKEPGYAGQEGWPRNGNHYQVALLQADGAYDLEKGGNYGDYFDYFTVGGELDPDSELHPNSNAYQNGDIHSIGIRIYDISPSSQLMHFRVSGLGASPTSSPSPSASPSEYPSPSPSANPTDHPSPNPTHPPTEYPSSSPTPSPTEYPSSSPTKSPHPSPSPTATLTEYPSTSSSYPTEHPSSGAKAAPAEDSSTSPASRPSAHSSLNPPASPSQYLSQNLTPSPSTFPSEDPSNVPASPVPTFSGVNVDSTELLNNGPTRRPWKLTTPTLLTFGESSLYHSRPPSAPAYGVLSNGPSLVPTLLRGALPSIAPSDSPITTLSVSPTTDVSRDPTLLSSTEFIPHGAIIKPSVTPSPTTSTSFPPSLAPRPSPSPRTKSMMIPMTTSLLSNDTGISNTSVRASIEPTAQPASFLPSHLRLGSGHLQRLHQRKIQHQFFPFQGIKI
ncbi:Immune inhibitor A peptidase M6 [Fragilaria crotonensis]|nr:Immune inhibitor A peptidase M6 [Fragilaria crotonensis]